ncbi:very-long-chain 3-oxoacyl-CoA reductase-like isoform X2 [Homalodisca vitripennis]|uniref:very-long-chain 3-oxoacyl-CoA reductase-like isoform X2 n=1 Tax=Homalodisca vitripennis TaxID=197043 RepID=UPI001EEA4F54|nr:very-long-chain 3-oxoacyl-CoA reductase-like isoform X2 [Homalodisca vitripennis]
MPTDDIFSIMHNTLFTLVITGATDGLGKAFAEAVAKRGMDVVLISRTKSKLDAVAQEIRENYKVNTKVIEADFTEGNTVYHHIEKELYGMDVGVLINNVGLSYPHPDQFLSLPEHGKVYHDIIQCNIAAMLSMCQIVMPGMCEQRRGVVINIGSTAGDIPSPMLTVYGASKVFVSKFSRDLASEYKQYGIVVQCLTPGYVATKMSKIKKPTWMAPSPAKYVNSALTTVGIEDHTTGYYPHSLLVGCIKLMESLSPNFAYWMITRTMENIKSRAIRKSNQIAAS